MCLRAEIDPSRQLADHELDLVRARQVTTTKATITVRITSSMPTALTMTRAWIKKKEGLSSRKRPRLSDSQQQFTNYKKNYNNNYSEIFFLSERNIYLFFFVFFSIEWKFFVTNFFLYSVLEQLFIIYINIIIYR